jgi:beta-galactosidase
MTVADHSGSLLPKTKNHLKFMLTGPAEILGMDKGDPTSFEPFQGSEHSAFNGLGLVILRSTGPAGPITLTAASDSLKPGRLTLRAR